MSSICTREATGKTRYTAAERRVRAAQRRERAEARRHAKVQRRFARAARRVLRGSRTAYLFVDVAVGFIRIPKRTARDLIGKLGTRLHLSTVGHGDAVGLEVSPF